MEYKEIYDKAKKEFEELRYKEAQIQESINSFVKQLGLDLDSPLEPQIQELKAKLEKEKKIVEADMEKLKEELGKYGEVF